MEHDYVGYEIRDRDLSGLRIVDCYGDEVEVSGGFGRIVVNDVDVTAYVEAELDRRAPARALAREATTVEDFRHAFQVADHAWMSTLARVSAWPEETLQARVRGEWSLTETLRHLLMAGDRWLGESVLDEVQPYHRLGLPSGTDNDVLIARLGLAVGQPAAYPEVLEARQARQATLSRYLGGLTEAELDRECERKPPWYAPGRQLLVRTCLRVLAAEEAEHHRYAERDLTVLEATRA